MDQPLYVARHKLLIVKAVYECKGCGHRQTIPQEGEKLKGPGGCPRCDSKQFKLLPDQSEFEDLGICGWTRVL